MAAARVGPPEELEPRNVLQDLVELRARSVSQMRCIEQIDHEGAVRRRIGQGPGGDKDFFGWRIGRQGNLHAMPLLAGFAGSDQYLVFVLIEFDGAMPEPDESHIGGMPCVIRS